MLLAGIDEAGYGPLLGPLVVGATAFEVPDGGATDLWAALRPAVTMKRDRKGGKLHVADSKQVYSPSAGLVQLERSVLAFASAAGLPVTSLDALVGGLDPTCPAKLARLPWYATPADEKFPVECSAQASGPDANLLRSAMRAAGVTPAALSLRVMPEADYNDRVRQTRNKGALLFSLAASLIFDLLELATAKRQPLTLVCDRQGGREHYVDPLRTMFPDWSLTVLEEAPAKAVYQLTRAGITATVSFQEKGESESLATALASMFCKYAREALMHRFNAFFLAHDPTLTPTAGYYTDALRFLQDTRALRTRLGLPDEKMVRER